MKRYGRAPTFLLLTGYEQARLVTAALAGDWAAARRVELELPETGVCSGPVAAGGGVASSCCGPTIAAPVTSLGLITLTPVGAVADGIGLAPIGVQSGLLTLTPVAEAPAACCAADVQVSCCEPEAKTGCCGAEPAAATSCGCQ